MLLSIDASTKSTGWAVYDGKRLVDYGLLTAGGLDMINRVYKITDGIDKLIQKYEIDKICLEQVFIEQGRQAATYTALMYLQANLMFLLHDKYSYIEVKYMLPSEWRKTIGIEQGRGIKRDKIKEQDIKKANALYGLNLTSDDIADAILIGHSDVNEIKEEFFVWT